jgi:hypothetical protein
MNKLKLGVGVLLIFALGALAGSLGTRLYVRERIVAFTRGDAPAVRMLKRISRELDLTQSQQEKIDKIVAEMQAELSDFRRRYHPEFVQIVDKTIELMKEQLNDAQKEKLDQLHERLKRRVRRRGFHRGVREDENEEQMEAYSKIREERRERRKR